MGVPLLGGHGTVWDGGWSFIDCRMVSCSVSLWAVLGINVLARWACKGLRPVEMAILLHQQKTPVSCSTDQSSPHLLGAEQGHHAESMQTLR